MKLFKIVLILGSFQMLSACNVYFKVNKDKPLAPLLETNEAQIDFAIIKESFLVNRCTTCHQQYNSYQSVKLELANIQKTIEVDRMPKSGSPLSLEQKKLLNDWIAIGAPEFQGQQPPQEPQPVLPSWSSVSETIFFPKCTVCHNPNGQAKFLDLSTQEALFLNKNKIFGDNQKLIDVENPEQSYLLSIVQDEFEPMPPSYSGITVLNQSQIELLKDWISLGIP